MTYRGHVKNGQIKLDEPARLPEGAEVNIHLVEQDAQSSATPRARGARRFQPIDMPGGSLAEELIRNRR